MATLTTIANILEKAKAGQYVSLKCANTSADFDAYVVQLGTDKVQNVKAEDWEEGWPVEEEDEKTIPLYFEAKTTNCTVALQKWNSPDTISLQISTDKINWSDYAIGNSITLTNVGDKVYFKNKTNDGKFSKDSSNYYYFKLNNSGTTGEIECHGNVMSLAYLDFVNETVITNSYQFRYTFTSCKVLKTAPALPATTLAPYCYSNMFNKCTSLTAAPKLPAETLADGCYQMMFYNCSSLIQAPELPATTLANYCYRYMFNCCTSLTQAPVLPATTLAESCYYQMFMSCTSLTQAPVLPATTLANNCYFYMFDRCNKFASVHMKSSMEDVYDTTTHGEITKTVIYDL